MVPSLNKSFLINKKKNQTLKIKNKHLNLIDIHLWTKKIGPSQYYNFYCRLSYIKQSTIEKQTRKCPTYKQQNIYYNTCSVWNRVPSCFLQNINHLTILSTSFEHCEEEMLFHSNCTASQFFFVRKSSSSQCTRYYGPNILDWI